MSENNSSEQKSSTQTNILDPKLGSYRSRYTAYKAQITMGKNEESGTMHSIQIGCGAAVISFIVLLFFVETGLIFFSIAIGILVGWLGGKKEREYENFITAVKVEYLLKVRDEYEKLLTQFRETHKEIFNVDNAIGFIRENEVCVLNKLENITYLQTRFFFLDYALDRKDPKKYLETQYVVIPINMIFDTIILRHSPENQNPKLLENLTQINPLLGFYSEGEVLDDVCEISYNQAGVPKRVILSFIVAEYVLTYWKMQSNAPSSSKERPLNASSSSTINVSIPLSSGIKSSNDELRPAEKKHETATGPINPMEALLNIQKANKKDE
jgi:hypothetical protein